MSSNDAGVRDAAATRLAWEVRWPSLLAACLMLVAVYELGRVVADPTTGLVAALVAGTTLMFLKFGRLAMIDVHLGLWVTVANVFLAHAILKRRRWTGCVGAGAALGMAFMLKGPVAWVQTLAPAVIYVIVRQFRTEPRERGRVRPWVLPIVVGTVVMLAVGLPWYFYVMHVMPEGRKVWEHEIVDPRGEKPSSVLGYLAILPYLLPWTVCFIGGIVSARRGMVLAVCLALLPLLLMTFYKDRKERYMFPVTGAAAVVAAGGVMTLARKRDPWNGLDKAAVAQHWVLLVAIGVIFPAAAALDRFPELQTVFHTPWLSRGWGAGLTIGLAVVIAAGLLFRRHWVAALVGATVVVMLTVQAAALHGYAQTRPGRSDMRPLANAIWDEYPEALMYNAHPQGKRASVDLSIYLNRVTRWISMEDLAGLKPGRTPKVVVMLQEQGDPAPKPPAGWTFVEKVKRDKDWWWAFALKAEG
jgi:4-amino-4-deoxy-L-arabinose transferase-like glycosyltransferase